MERYSRKFSELMMSRSYSFNEKESEKKQLDPMEKINYGDMWYELSLMGPTNPASKKLRKSKLTIDDIDLVESNEAFAAQSLAVIKELKIPLEKVK